MPFFIRFCISLCIYVCFCVILVGVRGQEEAPVKRPASTNVKKEPPMKGLSKSLDGNRFCTYEPNPVNMAATYYYGNSDKETIPVLLLHGTNGSSQDFLPLIDVLTNNGYAVLAPDLRGHGRSTKRLEVFPPAYLAAMNNAANNPALFVAAQNQMQQQLGNKPIVPKLVDYLAEDFQPSDYMAMLNADLPLFRKTLERVHEEGYINLNRLVIIGVDRGAALAAYQMMQDWKDKESPHYTRTLVLIAPMDVDSKAETAKLFTNKRLQDNLSILFAIPEGDAMSMGIAQQIKTAILDKDIDKEEKKALFPLLTYPTRKVVDEKNVTMSIQEVLGSKETNLAQTILQFLNKRNASFKTNFRWSRLK
ncbi:MAG: alpha/beta hydrolase [Thermoguttaceae bacterium]